MYAGLIEWLYEMYFDPNCCIETISITPSGSFTGGSKSVSPQHTHYHEYLSVQDYIDYVKRNN